MRTIESPGVEIREIDLTLNTELPNGTTVFVAGYASQGPVDELINITSMSELEQIYGTPVVPAERYFYHTCKGVLDSNGTLLTTRLPYGSGGGDGFTTNYSALVFPALPYHANATEYGAVSGEAITATVTGVDFSDVAAGAFSWYTSTIGNYVSADSALTITLSAVGDPTPGVVYTLNSGVLETTTPGASATWTAVASGVDEFTYSLAASSLEALSPAAFQVDITTSSTVLSGTPNYPKYSDATEYYIGQPTHITITDEVYNQWKEGGINWQDQIPDGATLANTLSGVDGVKYSAMVLVNELKSTINENFAGYYVALSDNTKIDRGSNFDNITSVKSITDDADPEDWITLNESRLNFDLTGTFSERQGSISEIVETVPGWDFGNTGPGGFNDSLILATFKLRPTLYSSEDRVLDSVLAEAYVGSLDSTRTINNPQGGDAIPFYLQEVVNSSSSTQRLYINPYISERSGLWFDQQTGVPVKSVRVVQDEKPNTDPYGTVLLDNPSNSAQPPLGPQKALYDALGSGDYVQNADSLYGVGEYKVCSIDSERYIGTLPRKLERALRLVENNEQIRLDIVPEGGLGTIWTGMKLDTANYPSNAAGPAAVTNREVFDDTRYINGILNPHPFFDTDSDGLLSQANGSASEASDLYESIFNIFNAFCETTRRDCIYIADPLRYIFVQGFGDRKVLDDKNKNFSQHVFWPLKNLYGGANTSYACTYANWLKVFDTVSSKFTWIPPSGAVAGRMIDTDTEFFPWFAPAGLTRGVLESPVDIGINPTSNQRDLLYKNGINPIVYWPGDGYLVWGQKTLLSKPSAFDRVNVRRLFLWLEKAVLPIARFFVFEQNTVFTRRRLVTALEPIFEFARSNEGIYDYMIVCDERNNPTEVIDRNELKVSIYVKPVRVAEFILIDFIATRTGANFEELI